MKNLFFIFNLPNLHQLERTLVQFFCFKTRGQKCSYSVHSKSLFPPELSFSKKRMEKRHEKIRVFVCVCVCVWCHFDRSGNKCRFLPGGHVTPPMSPVPTCHVDGGGGGGWLGVFLHKIWQERERRWGTCCAWKKCTKGLQLFFRIWKYTMETYKHKPIFSANSVSLD